MKLRIYADYGHFTAYYCHYFFVLLQDIECYPRILCKYLCKILYKRHRKSGQHVAAFFYGENHPYLFRFSEAADGLLTDAPHALEGLAPRFGHALRDDLRRDGSHALEEADGIERLEGLDRNHLERPLRVLADERGRLHDGQARKAERLHVPLDDALELQIEERRACIGTS